MLYKGCMDENRLFLETLKWVALVFAAGFVGYFGKFLGIQLISWLKDKRGNHADTPHTDYREAKDGRDRHGVLPSDTPVIEKEPWVSPSAGDVTAQDSSSVLDSQKQESIEKKREKERQKQEKKAGKADLKRQKKTLNHL